MSRALSGARAKLDSALGIASASPSFAQPSKRDSNLCLSLLPLFNFGADPSKVSHACGLAAWNASDGSVAASRRPNGVGRSDTDVW